MLNLAQAAPYWTGTDGWVHPNRWREAPLKVGDAYFEPDRQKNASSAVERFIRRKIAEALPGRVGHPGTLNVVAVPPGSYFRGWARPDILLPLENTDDRIAVEVDGRGGPGGDAIGHTGDRIPQDIEKSKAVVAAGWHVLRVRLHTLPSLTNLDGSPIPGVTNFCTSAGRADAALVAAIVDQIHQIKNTR